MKQIMITGYEFADFLDGKNNILYEWKDVADKIIQDEIDLHMSFNDDRFKDAKDKIIQDIINYNYLYDEDGNILGRVEEFDDIGM